MQSDSFSAQRGGYTSVFVECREVSRPPLCFHVSAPGHLDENILTQPLWALQSLTEVCAWLFLRVCECSPPAHCGADHKANCDEVLIKMDMWTDPVALSGIRTGLVNTRLIRQTTLESNSWMRSSSAARRGHKTFTYLFRSKLPRTNTQILKQSLQGRYSIISIRPISLRMHVNQTTIKACLCAAFFWLWLKKKSHIWLKRLEVIKVGDNKQHNQIMTKALTFTQLLCFCVQLN